VAIIDDTIARRFFPGQEPIGRTIKLESGGPMTIVGVVGSVKHDGPWYDTEPQIHSPFSQSSDLEMFVAVRCTGDPMQLATAVRATVASLDRNLPVERIRTMEQVFADSLSTPRLLTSFLAVFGAFGLSLAAIGIYGVIDYSVTQRTHEMGVRMAVGASPRGIISLVIWKGVQLVAAGVTIGVPSALAVSPLMRSPLVGISPRDVTVFTVVPIVLMAAAFVASYLPARRAVKIDPMEALRCE
jgi:putative ABC transport system permease protein